MGGRTHKRPWLAAVLAIVLPGLGHVYLRSWLRSLGWFWIGVLSMVLFVPEELIAGVDSMADAMSLSANLPVEATVALLLVTVFNALDAYWQARAGATPVPTDAMGSDRDGQARCPHCGHDLDEDLDIDFCPWCTEPLPGADADSNPDADGDGDGDSGASTSR